MTQIFVTELGPLPQVFCYLATSGGTTDDEAAQHENTMGLIKAVGERYRGSKRNEKRQILEGFIELTGYHRKQAIRVLCREPPR
ncbi:hypothetical protein [Mycetohabitans rhizoxinica]|uniref:hypothetical protein n=1 Tax=Mycetohabitans rhizoxinica TaxID=412963 RepID=UPI0030CC0042